MDVLGDNGSSDALAPDPLRSELPAHIVSLARAIARDCHAPGRYVIELTVPIYPLEALTFEVARLETIRRWG